MEPRGKKRSRAGFTLIELMVVVTIMGIIVGLALPTMTRSMADRRVNMVARDVVRIYRQARYASMAYGRAHAVWYELEPNPAQPADWSFRVYRGVQSGCFYNDWAPTLADPDNLVTALNSTDFDPDSTDQDSVRVQGWNRQMMCYEGGSNNELWMWVLVSASWDAQSQQGGLGYSVSRIVDSNPTGVMRKVFVPWGSTLPRILR